jgi:hypothetical protein
MRKPCRRRSGTASATFSNALNSSNRFISWNEREMPMRAIVRDVSPVMSLPSKTMRPPSGR